MTGWGAGSFTPLVVILCMHACLEISDDQPGSHSPMAMAREGTDTLDCCECLKTTHDDDTGADPAVLLPGQQPSPTCAR